MHQNFSISDGVDIAWIAVHNLNITSDILEVSNSIPEKCIRYQLELIDADSSNIQAGFHWVRHPETIHPNSSNMKPFRHGMLAFQFSEELDRTELEHVIMCNTKEYPDEFKLHFIAYGRAGSFSFDTDCRLAMCGEYKPESRQSLLQVNVSLSEEEQKISQNSNENSNGLKMAGIPDLVTAAMDDIEKSYSETFSYLESTLFESNSTEAQDDFAVMNISVLSDAFEDFVIANSTKDDFHQSQQMVHNSSEDNNEDVSLSGYLNNINEDASHTLLEEDSMEPVIQASSWNAVYSVPSSQIPSPMSDKATPEYFADNFGKSPTKKFDQGLERCGNPATTSTCPPLLLEPSPPVTTESSTSTGVVCGATHREVAPTTNQTFNSSATAEAEMERRRQNALRKILIHLVRSRSEAVPIVIAGSTGFVLVAMGFVILMMVI